MKPILLALLALALTGCASLPNSKPDPRDPLERLNRTTFAFNDALDRNLARPVARLGRAGGEPLTESELLAGIEEALPPADAKGKRHE